jgi:hypothetical protein
MSLAGAIADIQTKALTITGIKAAPTNPPESINQLPFSVCYARSLADTELATAGWTNAIFTIVCELHCSRQVLPKAVAQSTPLAEALLSKIVADPTLSGTVQTVVKLRGTFGYLAWDGRDAQHLGWRIEVDVKLSIKG